MVVAEMANAPVTYASGQCFRQRGASVLVCRSDWRVCLCWAGCRRHSRTERRHLCCGPCCCAAGKGSGMSHHQRRSQTVRLFSCMEEKEVRGHARARARVCVCEGVCKKIRSVDGSGRNVTAAVCLLIDSLAFAWDGG